MLKASINNSSNQQELLSCCFFDHVSPNINKLWLLPCYLRVPFQLASPPGFTQNTSRRGTLYIILFVREFLSSLPCYQSTTETEKCKLGQTAHQHTAHSSCSSTQLLQQHTARQNPNAQPKYRKLLGVVWTRSNHPTTALMLAAV